MGEWHCSWTTNRYDSPGYSRRSQTIATYMIVQHGLGQLFVPPFVNAHDLKTQVGNPPGTQMYLLSTLPLAVGS